MRAFFYGSCPFSSFKPPQPISKKQKEKPHYKQTPIHTPLPLSSPPLATACHLLIRGLFFSIPP